MGSRQGLCQAPTNHLPGLCRVKTIDDPVDGKTRAKPGQRPLFLAVWRRFCSRKKKGGQCTLQKSFILPAQT